MSREQPRYLKIDNDCESKGGSMSITTKMLVQLSKTPMGYGEVQKFVFKHSARYKQGEKKAPGGWWCNNIRILLNKEIIKYNSKGLLAITPKGRKNINKPFATTKSDLKKAIKSHKGWANYYYKEANRLRAENRELKERYNLACKILKGLDYERSRND